MASKKSGKAAGLAALAGLAYMASQKGGKSAPDRDDADTYTGSRASKSEDATESGDFLSRRLKTNPESGAAYSMDNLSPMSSGKSVSGSRAATPTPAEARSAPVKSGSSGPISGDAFDNERTGGDARMGRNSSGSKGPLSGEAFNNAPARNPGGAGKRGGSSATSSGSGSGGPLSGSAFNNSTKAPSRAVVEKQAEYGTRSDVLRSGLGGVRRPGTNVNYENEETSDMGMKRGGKVKKMASGGMTSSASRRGDGIASKGKTRCKMY